VPKRIAKRPAPTEQVGRLFWQALFRVRRPVFVDLAGEPLRLYGRASKAAVEAGLSQHPEPAILAQAELPECVKLRSALKRWGERWHLPAFCRPLAWEALERWMLWPVTAPAATPPHRLVWTGTRLQDEGPFVTIGRDTGMPDEVGHFTGRFALDLPGWAQGAGESNDAARARLRKGFEKALRVHVAAVGAAFEHGGWVDMVPRDLEWLARRIVPVVSGGRAEMPPTIGKGEDPPMSGDTVAVRTRAAAEVLGIGELLPGRGRPSEKPRKTPPGF
jgi:hypothetical protein